MPTRRQFLRGGLGAVVAGLTMRRAWAGGEMVPSLPGFPPSLVRNPCPPTGALPTWQTRPLELLPLSPDSVMVDGLPFAPRFTGDDYAFADFPFHSCENCFPANRPPDPTEEVELAIVGGGLSGLAAAYLLRDRSPVLFELKNRFGGVSAGESWGGTPYSLGGAYFITPDEESFLESLYRELELDQVVRVDEGQFFFEYRGAIQDRFWEGKGLSADEREAVRRYTELVAHYGENYPEIPLPDGPQSAWIRELDRLTLKDDIEQRVGMPLPRVLEQAIQAYCYSSFGAGWQDLSAAGGWNFLAAEEFGRWVLPGGNAYLVDQMWRRLALADSGLQSHCSGGRMRGGCRVVDVRLVEGRRVQVTYRDPAGQFRSLLTRRVVMACAKMIAKYIIRRLDSLDAEKLESMHNVHYAAYAVANVLLSQPISRDFYDLFLLGSDTFPMTPAAFEQRSEVVDVLSGHYARQGPSSRSVLTLYWPLPWASSRFTLLDDNAWQSYAESIAPQVRRILALLEVRHTSVRQIRLTRWGHAMPVSAPHFLADGHGERLRRPINDQIWFVNQDNWALPAVENCLLDAQWVAEQIAALP